MARMWVGSMVLSMTAAVGVVTGCWTQKAADTPDGMQVRLELPMEAETTRAVAETLKEHWRLPFALKESSTLATGQISVGTPKAADRVRRVIQGELAEVAIPAYWEALVDVCRSSESVQWQWQMTAPAWQGLPIPLDALIVALGHESDAEQPGIFLSVTLPEGEWWSRAVDLWNVYAWLKYFSTGDFDPAAERTAYLQENFGPAEMAMREYFRIGERTYMTAAALAGIERPERLDPVEVFSRPVLEKLQQALDQAYDTTAPGTKYRANVEQELQHFAGVRQRLEAEIEARIRRLRLRPGTMTPFQPLVTLGGEAAPVAAAVAMRADNANLYLIFQADEPRMESVQREHAGRDEAGMWDDDGFEIFLMPDPEQPQDGYQFIVNANGAVWDGLRTATQCDVAWSASGARGEVETSASGWQLTLTLPWRDFGFDGIPAKPWRANFYRNRMAGGEREAYAWAPVLGASYYQPARFGWLYWSDQADGTGTGN